MKTKTHDSRTHKITITLYCVAVLAVFAFLFLQFAGPSGQVEARGTSPGLAPVSFPGENLGPIPDAVSGCSNPAPTSRDVTFNVTGLVGKITAVELTADIRHTWVGDLSATLIAPTGEQHVLFAYTGHTPTEDCGWGKDLVGNYTFTDAASGTNWWTAAATNVNEVPIGSYRTTEAGPQADASTSPVTDMNAAFQGLRPNGVWTLRVNDANFEDTGSVESAQLTITTAIPPLATPFDFDGDGLTDVSIFRPNPTTFAENSALAGSSSQWWLLFSSNKSNLAVTFGQPDDILVPADYTGDGKADVAFFRPSTSEWYILRSEDMSFYSFPFGTSGDIPVHGDFDGDGVADPGVYRPSEGNWYILRSSDSAVSIVPFGISEDLPTVSDFDGDGIDDIAVYRPSVQEWWQLRSTAGAIAYQFGTPEDKVVVGDYTGDGIADVAFFRPSNSNWYILRSEDASFFSFPWGSAGDIPAPGDYDGDGITDAAIFRPSESTWYINGSTDGFFAVQFGASTDIPLPSLPVVP